MTLNKDLTVDFVAFRIFFKCLSVICYQTADHYIQNMPLYPTITIICLIKLYTNVPCLVRESASYNLVILHIRKPNFNYVLMSLKKREEYERKKHGYHIIIHINYDPTYNINLLACICILVGSKSTDSVRTLGSQHSRTPMDELTLPKSLKPEHLSMCMVGMESPQSRT